MRKLRLARERVRRRRFECGFPIDRWEVLGEHSITPLMIPSVTRVYDSMQSTYKYSSVSLAKLAI